MIRVRKSVLKRKIVDNFGLLEKTSPVFKGNVKKLSEKKLFGIGFSGDFLTFALRKNRKKIQSHGKSMSGNR